MAKHFVIFGRQGAGKGTQSELIVGRYDVVHLSTGDMLRSAIAQKTAVGMAVKAIIDSGALVDDDLICDLVIERMEADNLLEKGTLFDGFPRTTVQAEALEDLFSEVGIDAAINLEVPVEVVTERMLARGRGDDTPEAIAQRLALYEEQTRPVLDWFEQRSMLITVDGVGTPEEVFDRLCAQIDAKLGIETNGDSVGRSSYGE